MLFISFVFISCKKETGGIVDNKKKQIEPIESNSALPGITVYDYTDELQTLINMVSCNDNGYLSFNSAQDVDFVMDELDRLQEEYENSFEENFSSSLTADELDDMDINYGFNSEQPLIDFENAFPCYSSLRERIAQEEEDWLYNCNNDLDINTDPTDNYITTDETEQTLYSKESKIEISNQVYDLSTLSDPSTGLINLRTEGCESHKRTAKLTPNTDNTLCVKTVLAISGDNPWGSGGAVKAKTKGYVKKNNGRFRKGRIDISVMLNGLSKPRNIDCTGFRRPVEYLPKAKKRKKVKVKDRYTGENIRVKVQSDPTLYDLISFHQAGNIQMKL